MIDYENIFQSYFMSDGVFDGSEEIAVHCPFPHYDENGKRYHEKNSSAHINVEKGLFNCKTCGKGLNIEQFVQKAEGLKSNKEAKQFVNMLSSVEDQNYKTYVDRFKNPEEGLLANLTLEGLNLFNNTEFINTIQIGSDEHGNITVPAFVNGILTDVRTYRPEGKPKVCGLKGSKTGVIIPYDIWKDDRRPTLICAGEKDMLAARSMGINAITITGGELKLPEIFLSKFENREVYIMYDNDPTGKEGSHKLAEFLFNNTGTTVKMIFGHYDVCIQKGEDLWDYVNKYGKYRNDILELMKNAEEYTQSESRKMKKKKYKEVQVIDATNEENINRYIQSTVQVKSNFDAAYACYRKYVFTKGDITKKKVGNNLYNGEVVEFTLDEKNLQNILKLVDSNLKDSQIISYVKSFVGLSEEDNVQIECFEPINIFKSVIGDLVDGTEMSKEYKEMFNLVIYTLGEKLNNGQKYNLTYKVVRHPLQGQVLVGVVIDIDKASDDLTSFKITNEVKEQLKLFQPNEVTLDEKLDEMFIKAKGLGEMHNKDIFTAIELTYHSVSDITLGIRDFPGMLDIMIIGDGGTGKSSGANTLRNVYNLGTKISLKGASIQSIIGGTDMSGGYKTKMGLLPLAHGTLIVFEEFSDIGKDLVKSLTDIKTEKIVRIHRVAGEIVAEAKVRMLTITNPAKKSDGETNNIRKYANGIKVITELVGAKEDIRRYDAYLLIKAAEDNQWDFEEILEQKKEHYPIEALQNRVKWAWTRKKEDIEFVDGADKMIIEFAKVINQEIKTDYQIFGPETPQKVARIATAYACMFVSTDNSFEKVIVTPDHINMATKWLRDLYQNDTFKINNHLKSIGALTTKAEIEGKKPEGGLKFG